MYKTIIVPLKDKKGKFDITVFKNLKDRIANINGKKLWWVDLDIERILPNKNDVNKLILYLWWYATYGGGNGGGNGGGTPGQACYSNV